MKHLDGTGIIECTMLGLSKYYLVGRHISVMRRIDATEMNVWMRGDEAPFKCLCTEEEFQKLIESFAF